MLLIIALLYADKGVAPLSFDHESNMLNYYTNPHEFRLDGIRTRDSGIERAMSYHLTTNPWGNNELVSTIILREQQALISPVQVSHLLLLITKQLHYFYANQA